VPFFSLFIGIHAGLILPEMIFILTVLASYIQRSIIENIVKNHSDHSKEKKTQPVRGKTALPLDIALRRRPSHIGRENP
jgi:hypothetical protein